MKYSKEKLAQIEAENQEQMKVDLAIFRRYLRYKDFEPEWVSWCNLDNAKKYYRSIMKKIEAAEKETAEAAALEEERKKAGRELQAMKNLCTIMGNYTCQVDEAHKALQKAIDLIEAEKTSYKQALYRRRKAKRKAEGYKFNGRTKTWYKPKEE